MDDMGQRDMTRRMNWDCKKDGCFNVRRRPKFGVFDDCFPRRINFTDVDGLVEIGGHFLMMEWKGDGGSIKKAQHLVFQRFTSNPMNVVIIVHGDAETMSVQAFGYYFRGKYHEAKTATLSDLKKWLRRWATWSDRRLAPNR